MANLIRRMQGPTGRVTEVTLSDGQFVGFRITEADGSLVDDLHLRNGTWKSTGGGRQAEDAMIDIDGNITIVETDGNRTAHLACGEEVLTRYDRNGLPTESLALRDGKETARFDYLMQEGRFSAFARFPGEADSVPVKPEDTVIVSRLRAAGLTI